MAIKPVSVSRVNAYIKSLLLSDPILVNIGVCGEVSNLTKHSTGHWYFSLKDENSTIRCFLPADRVRSLRCNLSEGMQINAYGYISVYERGGYYSLNIKDIDFEGEGALKQAYEKLKNSLAAEGLFADEHKKALPSFPRKIGVVTSPTGAAIRDIITTAKRRSNLVDILLYPCLVQGPDAAASIAEGIKFFNEKQKDIDILIVGRGGGSAEDLWAFNEEAVVRAIYESEIPVISAVGHEVDFVLSDFAADLRGATPTAAAELAVPHLEQILDRLRYCNPENMFAYLCNRQEQAELKLKSLSDSCSSYIDNLLTGASHKVSMLKLDIDSYNPLLQLEKGYAIVNSGDEWISNINQIEKGKTLKITLKGGSADCTVTEVYNG